MPIRALSGAFLLALPLRMPAPIASMLLACKHLKRLASWYLQSPQNHSMSDAAKELANLGSIHHLKNAAPFEDLNRLFSK